MQNTVRAQIDLSALTDNLKAVRALCPTSRVMAMLKADAYGHGLLFAARALYNADGFGVARLKEALSLRNAGITQRILLLGTLLSATDLELCSEQSIDVTVHNRESLTSIATAAQRMPLRVWLKLDSGMHRLGLNPKAFVEADELLRKLPGITELTHMTHFSSADNYDSTVMDRQVACFTACHRTNPSAKASLANSAAIVSRSEVHSDWVRPGIMLYGENPHAAYTVAVRPAMTLTTHVIAIRSIAAGESVGYSEAWMSVRKSRMATLGIGYGDGYPRHAQNGTPVWIKGHLVPITGRVSMDSLSVDITDSDGVSVGDEAVLWGPQLNVSTVAKWCNSISYALYSCLSGRVDREYSNAL